MDSNKTSSSSNETNTNRDQYLKHLNKLSHKISKPLQTRKPNFDPPAPIPQNPPPLQHQQLQSSASQQQQQQQPPNQHQPPVYNINKNDFRDVVQKLTGSPAHTADRFAPPPPIHPPKTQSSRLQRIRPPPLAQLASRPPPPLNGGVFAQPRNNSNNNPLIRAPLSPLPPLPTVHGAAESPVSAYMRFLNTSIATGGGGGDSNQNMNGQKYQHFSGFSPLAPLVSPRWTNLTPPPQQQPEQNQNPNQQLRQSEAPEPSAPPAAPAASPQPQFNMPLSPLPFGCLNSPRSQFGLLSPNNQLGFPQLPLSPTVPAVPSPTWRGF